MYYRITPLCRIRYVNYLEFEFRLQVSGGYFVNRINDQISKKRKEKNSCIEASLVAHWWRTACSRKRDRVTPCSGKVSHAAVTEPVGHSTTPVLPSPGAPSTEPASTATEAPAPRACAPQLDKPSKKEAHWLQPERRVLTTTGEKPSQQQDRAQPKINKI